KETIAADFAVRKSVSDAIVNQGCRRVGILGLAYKGDLKVSVMSPSIAITRHLRSAGIDVRINDPLYSDAEIVQIAGVDAFRVPEGLPDFDALLVATDHRRYLDQDVRAKVSECAGNLLILDNFGIWKEWDWPQGTRYFCAGHEGWLGPFKGARV